MKVPAWYDFQDFIACNVSESILQVQDATSSDKLQDLLMDEIDLLAESGCNIPIAHVTLNNRRIIVATVALHRCLLKAKAEVDQFRQGLAHESGPLLKLLAEKPEDFESWFCITKEQLSAGVYSIIMSLLVPPFRAGALLSF